MFLIFPILLYTIITPVIFVFRIFFAIILLLFDDMCISVEIISSFQLCLVVYRFIQFPTTNLIIVTHFVVIFKAILRFNRYFLFFSNFVYARIKEKLMIE